MKGVIFVTSSSGAASKDLILQALNNETFSCLSTSSGFDTGIALEQMARQNGAYPAVIVLHDSIGREELRALASRVGDKTNLIIIAASYQNPEEYTQLGFASHTIVVEGENGLKTSQLSYIRDLLEYPVRAYTQAKRAVG